MRTLSLAAVLTVAIAACNSDKDSGGLEPGDGGGDDGGATDGGGDGGDTGGDGGWVEETECPEAESLLGYQACIHRIVEDADFSEVTILSSSVDQMRVGKYLVPADDKAPLPGMFLDVNNFVLHYDLLVTAFPDLYSGITQAQYEDLTINPDTRQYYAGTYSLYIDEKGLFYGFTAWDDATDDSTTVTMADVQSVYDQLQERFLIGDLYFVPSTSNQTTAAADWDDAGFPIRGLAEVEYEAYNQGEGFGTLRLYTTEGFVKASEATEYSWTDIVAVEQAPYDIETVVSGIVTGSRQGDLSHLSVRSSSRGTPNCYVNDILKELAAWDGMLVRFECGESSYSIREASQEEADVWWESIRPDPVDVCEPDLLTTDLTGLLDVDTSSQEIRQANFCTYGCKSGNLATLYQRIDTDLQHPGFMIPFYYYDQFMRENSWTVDLGGGEASYTYQETLEAWWVDEEFNTDAAVRREKLEALQEAMDDGEVSAELMDLLETRIMDVYGDATIMTRYRSSSNAEDSLFFSGAGLYNSQSGCLADSQDGDEEGPSLCDPDQDEERTLERAVRNVWEEAWNFIAWEERTWFGIDPANVAMGILVIDRANDEQANIVGFSGNSTSFDDERYLINAQEGEAEVVSSDPGVVPERILLTLSESGEVTKIDRLSGSTETDDGIVLTDDEVTATGESLFDIASVFPLDYDVPEGGYVIWDTEWKITSEGELKVKQIRPFLMQE